MLSITPDKPIKDIQQEFSQAFPFLKVEFLSSGSNVIEFIPTEYYLQVRFLSAERNEKRIVQINLTPGITIKELEEKCEELFGVSVQVYRKFGNLWLKTTITKNFTLQQQNDHLREVALCMA